VNVQFLSGSPNEEECLEDLGIDDRMILNNILEKWV
jgi:hypothetical protein